MHFSSFREFINEINFKFSLCFIKRNKFVNAKVISMVLIIILTIGSSHEIIKRFAKWAERPKGRVFTMEHTWIERPSITSWLLLLPLLLSSLFAAAGIVARKGELVIMLAVILLFYSPLLFYSLYASHQLHVLDPRLLLFFAAGSILLILHCVFILIAAKNEIDREVEEVVSIGKSMEFSETDVGFIRHFS
ncbi:hypothetical protein PENTCL1PPCAC_21456 [Pristionchus entomophagus]|uniref:Uncharacterized protein n=1 Tax=Pristionchus entomophagus TaxID=358040 RepID=A0AAV5TYE4_9BILA|nr:hypothetical protein PENTCL1PPCAC_21456 [Pristionchus entomophagus]